MAYGVSLSTWIIAHSAVKEYLFSGSDVAKIKIITATSEELAEILLSEEDSEVNLLTGVLTLAILEQEDSAPNGGTASFAEIYTADGSLMMSLPCMQGEDPVAGYCVLDDMNILASTSVTIQDVVIQTGATIPV